MPRQEFDPTRTQLATRIPVKLHRAVKLAAFEADETVRDWVAEALEAHLARCHGTTRDESGPGRPPVTARKRTAGAA